MTKERAFQGFSKETITFLRGIRDNNNKPWFEAHRSDYDNHVIADLKDLVVDLGAAMKKIDPAFDVTPAINKTVSRIYRDTRFSKDKSPYKSAMWISFKRSKKEWQSAPAYYFEIAPDTYRYGMGFYAASSSVMKDFREMIDNDPKAFKKAVAFFAKQDRYTLEGDMYKRIFDDSKPPEIQEWYQRKSFYLMCQRKHDDRLFSAELVDELIAGFKMTKPLYDYLWGVK